MAPSRNHLLVFSLGSLTGRTSIPPAPALASPFSLKRYCCFLGPLVLGERKDLRDQRDLKDETLAIGRARDRGATIAQHYWIVMGR